MNALLQTIVQVARLAAFAGIGVILNKRKILPPEFRIVGARLITKLFLPMMIIGVFIDHCSVQSLRENAALVLNGVIMMVISVAAGYLYSRFVRCDTDYARKVFWYAAIFTNTGSFLTPLNLAFLGTAGEYRSFLFLFPTVIATYGWGVSMLIPHGTEKGFKALCKHLINPVIVALLIGMTLGLLGGDEWIPEIVQTSIQQLGGFFSPMSLILAGFVFADYPAKNLIPNRQTRGYIGIRMILLPLFFLFFFRAIGAPRDAAYFSAAIFACPCGMNAVTFPLSYGQDCRSITNILMGSTLAAVAIVPIIYMVMDLVL